MTVLARLARERADLSEDDLEQLRSLTSEWSLIADLALSDLVLWLPTWNDGGLVAGAQVRPATAPTTIADDIVGSFIPRTRSRVIDRVLAIGTSVNERASERPLVPASVEAHPIVRDGRIIAVLERRASLSSRPIGRLEQIYLESADDLISMVTSGSFPDPDVASETEAPPRAGDGLIRLDVAGKVRFASPNAQSAYHRLGLGVALQGSELSSLTRQLVHEPGPVDEALLLVTSGKASAGTEIDNGSAAVTLRSLPLRRAGERIGALVLVRDVTDLRRRERALLSKDATIREVHHRVKNNLQTVAALLRLQARRTTHPDARQSLDEAVRRVAAIGVVHETLASSGDSDERVNFDDIVDRLLGLTSDFVPQGVSVSLSREGTFGVLSARVATPLSVVITELLHNAIEHGVAEGGAVHVRAVRASASVSAHVIDDGSGLPTDYSDGLGLQIVRTLVTDELGGSLNLRNRDGAPGTQAEVYVPLSARDVRREDRAN